MKKQYLTPLLVSLCSFNAFSSPTIEMMANSITCASDGYVDQQKASVFIHGLVSLKAESEGVDGKALWTTISNSQELDDKFVEYSKLPVDEKVRVCKNVSDTIIGFYKNLEKQTE